MKISLLAWARESGGAERQLVNLANGLRRRGHDVLVIVFFSNAYVEQPLREGGTAVHVLGVRGRWDVWRYLVRLLRVVRDRRDDIVYTFLQAPNLLTVPLRLLERGTKIVWGIRTSDFLINAGGLSRTATRLEVGFSGRADLVIANSRKGRADAVACGVDERIITLIPNGIDTGFFRPDPEGGARVRSAWGVRADQRIIGFVGRMDSRMKDLGTFLQAASIVARERAELRFACLGEARPAVRRRLVEQASALGLRDHIFWPGFVNDMRAVYSAMDVVTLTSAYGEGFPNAIAEAMACGRPCVATDVGDAALILGGLGWVVPPRRPDALSRAWVEAIAGEPDRDLCLRRRRHIVENYPLERMIEGTEAALLRLL